jgi:hypothetical protein
MAWLQLIVGSAAIVFAALRFRHLKLVCKTQTMNPTNQ